MDIPEMRWILKKGVDGRPREKLLQYKIANLWLYVPTYDEADEFYYPIKDGSQ